MFGPGSWHGPSLTGPIPHSPAGCGATLCQVDTLLSGDEKTSRKGWFLRIIEGGASSTPVLLVKGVVGEKSSINLVSRPFSHRSIVKESLNHANRAITGKGGVTLLVLISQFYLYTRGSRCAQPL